MITVCYRLEKGAIKIEASIAKVNKRWRPMATAGSQINQRGWKPRFTAASAAERAGTMNFAACLFCFATRWGFYHITSTARAGGSGCPFPSEIYHLCVTRSLCGSRGLPSETTRRCCNHYHACTYAMRWCPSGRGVPRARRKRRRRQQGGNERLF